MKPSHIERDAILCYLNDVWLSKTPNDFMSPYQRAVSKGYCNGLMDAMNAIKEAPAADVRHVVFCRDCKYARRYSNKIKCSYWINEIVYDDDFCSQGYKRGELI